MFLLLLDYIGCLKIRKSRIQSVVELEKYLEKIFFALSEEDISTLILFNT
jgi:hypothetical protein